MKDKKERAIQLYKERKVSLGKAAEIAGLSIWETMELFKSRGVKNNMTVEDYEKELRNLRKVWKKHKTHATRP